MRVPNNPPVIAPLSGELVLGETQLDILACRMNQAARALIDKGFVEPAKAIITAVSFPAADAGFESCEEEAYESVESLNASTSL